MILKTLKLIAFVVKPVIALTVGVSYLRVKSQRNKARKEIEIMKREVVVAENKATMQEERAERAETTIKETLKQLPKASNNSVSLNSIDENFSN